MSLVTDAGRLLDRLDIVRHPCDLDLLVFFARHPRTLLSSDQIAAFLGYEVRDVAASLELLLDAGFLTRTPNPRHVARMYVLAATAPGGGWLPALTRLATTRQGRLALLVELGRRSSGSADDPTQQGHRSQGVTSPPLRFPQGRPPVDDARRRTRAASTEAFRQPPKTNAQGGTR